MSKRLSCFTPEVMLATFVAELALAVYILFRYRLNAIARIAVLSVVALAVFQGSEYMVCTGAGTAIFWAKIGFVAITLLPPLGLHLVGTLRSGHRPTWIGYAIAGLVVSWLLLPGGIVGAICSGNYVIFDLHPVLEPLYGLYYFGLLGVALLRAVRIAGRSRPARWFILGYLTFIFPMGIVFLLNDSALQAVPSIMCGFAAFFAGILALKVVPLTQAKR